jgi:hypothetical protein
MIFEDSFHLVFAHSGLLVCEDAISVSIYSFSVGKVNVLFACKLSIEVKK